MENEKILKRADPSTIHEKFLVGYQGWFTCAGDGDPIDPGIFKIHVQITPRTFINHFQGHHGWLH
ncbi:hypothetical protein MPER_16346, partial [Moniliophthora perniciosa FA553]